MFVFLHAFSYTWRQSKCLVSGENWSWFYMFLMIFCQWVGVVPAWVVLLAIQVHFTIPTSVRNCFCEKESYIMVLFQFTIAYNSLQNMANLPWHSLGVALSVIHTLIVIASKLQEDWVDYYYNKLSLCQLAYVYIVCVFAIHSRADVTCMPLPAKWRK